MPVVISSVVYAIGVGIGAATSAVVAIGTAIGTAVTAIGVGNIIQLGLAVAVQFIGNKKRRTQGGSTYAQGGNATNPRQRGLTLMVRESDYPRRIIYGEAKVGGIWFYAQTSGTDNIDLHLVLGIGEGPIEGIEAVYFGEERLILSQTGNDTNGVDILSPVGGKYAPLVEIKLYDGSQTLADADLITVSNNLWSQDHKLQGIAYAYLKIEYDADIFAAGLPEISFLIKGRRDIYDPRTTLSSYTTNPALCLAHYLTLEKFGPNADYATEINESVLIGSANNCEEQVITKARGYENRYACNGAVFLDQTPENNIADFTSAMAGWTLFNEGKFSISSGAHEVPSFTITEDMITGPVKIRGKQGKRDRVNTVKGIYVASENNYQRSDFPARTVQAYKDADGEELVMDIDLDFVASPSQAQRIASIELEEARKEVTVDLVCNLRAFPAQAGKNVMFTYARRGWERKFFKVMSFAIRGSDDGNLEVHLTLKETDAFVYEWDASEEIIVYPAREVGTSGSKVLAPYSTPPSGALYEDADFPLTVELHCYTPGATIRWSFSGDPGTITDGNAYTGPITHNRGDGSIQMRAFKSGYDRSDFAQAFFSVPLPPMPVITAVNDIIVDIGNGPQKVGENVKMATSDPDLTIYWTTSGHPLWDEEANDWTDANGDPMTPYGPPDHYDGSITVYGTLYAYTKRDGEVSQMMVYSPN